MRIPRDPESINHQLDLFEEASLAMRKEGITPELRHAANSAALLKSPRSCYDVVRPGIALFGVEPRSRPVPRATPGDARAQ